MADLNARAAEMFAAGESVNAVAKALFKNYYAKAKKQHALWLAETGAEPKRKKRAAQAEVELEPEALHIWDMTIEVPSDRVAALFGTFTPAEQITAVATVIQGRMGALLEA